MVEPAPPWGTVMQVARPLPGGVSQLRGRTDGNTADIYSTTASQQETGLHGVGGWQLEGFAGRNT